MKYKDFKSALNFLEEYGFEYGMDSVTNKKECYRNFYGEIVLDYYRLDANDYIPQIYIYIYINGWKTKINIDNEYEIVSNKKMVNYYTKVHEVIKLELITNYKIFDIIVENKYLSNLTKIYEYVYPYKKEYLFYKLENLSFSNNIRIINDNMFFILLKSTHAGGLWYVANIFEENELTKISGKILTNPDDNGKQSIIPYTKKQKIKDMITIILVFIFFWWIILIALAIIKIVSLFKNKQYKNKETNNRLSKIDNFMVNKLCCKKIDNVSFDTLQQIKTQIIDFDYFELESKIISLLNSKEIQHFLKENINSFNILQLATIIAENASKTNRLYLFKKLKKLSLNKYENKLISIAIKEIKRYGLDDKKTASYYEKNDPRFNKPSCPFLEYIDFPILFKRFDVALFKVQNENTIILINKLPLNNINNQDYDDKSYLAYDLKFQGEVNEDKLFEIHCHPHVCNLERMDTYKLDEEYIKNINAIIKYFKENEV